MISTQRWMLRSAFAAIAVLHLVGRSEGGNSYSYTRIVDTSGAFSFLDAVSVNAGGTVAFRAGLDAGGQGIFTTAGGSLNRIADTNGFIDSFFAGTSINDSGAVAFGAVTDVGGEGVFVGNVAQLTTIVDSGGIYDSFGGVSINNFGLVVTSAGLRDAANSNTRIIVGSGGATTELYAAETSPFRAFFVSQINDSGMVVFQAVLDGESRLGVFAGDGGPVTAIADPSSGPLSNTSQTAPKINAAGAVAFAGTLDTGPEGIFLGDGNSLTTTVDDSGPFSPGFGSILVSESGEVAFRAFLDSGGSGLFAGPDPILDRIIGTGDILDGSTAASRLTLGGFGPSGSGSFVFSAVLADGRTGIYRADPIGFAVPEPASLMTAGVGLIAVMGIALRKRRPA